MRRPRESQDFPGIRGRGMPRPYSKTNIHAIPRHELHRTGRGDACVARGCGRIFGGFVGEACLAPTARQTIMPSPGAFSIEPVGATHASPAGVAGFSGNSRARHTSPLQQDRHSRHPQGTISIEPVGATHASPAGMAGFSGDSRARHASPLQQDKHSRHPQARSPSNR